MIITPVNKNHSFFFVAFGRPENLNFIDQFFLEINEIEAVIFSPFVCFVCWPGIHESTCACRSRVVSFELDRDDSVIALSSPRQLSRMSNVPNVVLSEIFSFLSFFDHLDWSITSRRFTGISRLHSSSPRSIVLPDLDVSSLRTRAVGMSMYRFRPQHLKIGYIVLEPEPDRHWLGLCSMTSLRSLSANIISGNVDLIRLSQLSNLTDLVIPSVDTLGYYVDVFAAMPSLTRLQIPLDPSLDEIRHLASALPNLTSLGFGRLRGNVEDELYQSDQIAPVFSHLRELKGIIFHGNEMSWWTCIAPNLTSLSIQRADRRSNNEGKTAIIRVLQSNTTLISLSIDGLPDRFLRDCIVPLSNMKSPLQSLYLRRLCEWELVEDLADDPDVPEYENYCYDVSPLASFAQTLTNLTILGLKSTTSIALPLLSRLNTLCFDRSPVEWAKLGSSVPSLTHLDVSAMGYGQLVLDLRGTNPFILMFCTLRGLKSLKCNFAAPQQNGLKKIAEAMGFELL